MTALLTRSDPGALPRAVRFGVGGRKCAVASDEFELKLIDVRNVEDIQLLSGHTKGNRAISWNPAGTIVTSSGCDGTIRVWSVPSDASEPSCVKVIEGIIGISEAGYVRISLLR